MQPLSEAEERELGSSYLWARGIDWPTHWVAAGMSTRFQHSDGWTAGEELPVDDGVRDGRHPVD